MDFDPEEAFRECTDPKNWAYMARALQKAASLIDWKKQNVTDWRDVPIYRMLMGFSLENLLKGILIAEGHAAIVEHKLNCNLGRHFMRELAEMVKGVTISDYDKQVLYELEPYVIWAGRYPTPLKAAEEVRRGHSDSLHDAELALIQKLYDYLRECIPEIEPFNLAQS